MTAGSSDGDAEGLPVKLAPPDPVGVLVEGATALKLADGVAEAVGVNDSVAVAVTVALALLDVVAVVLPVSVLVGVGVSVVNVVADSKSLDESAADVELDVVGV